MATCDTCGLLSIRRMSDRKLVEVEESFRETGRRVPILIEHSSGASEIGFTYEEVPVCPLGQVNFRKAVEQGIEGNSVFGQTPPGQTVLELLRKQHECDYWQQWVPGLTMKEHIDMNILDREIERNERMIREQREWQERVERNAQNRHNWSLIIVGVAATAAICGTTIIAAFIPVWFGN